MRARRVLRLCAALLLFAIALALLSACAPRGRYTNALGASYTFRSRSRYTHTDAFGVRSSGTYEIEGDSITFTPKGSSPYTLPFAKDGDSITIGDLVYSK